jgi:hypothetical protein
VRIVGLVAIACVGCVSQVGNDEGTRARDAGEVDAAVDAAPIDARVRDAPADANACPSGRVVFLSFGGDTLTRAAQSDATADTASWVGMSSGQTTGTLPEWRPTASDRTSQIAAVVDELEAKFSTIAPTMQFATTRPVAGPYVMIGFGGSQDNVGVPYTTAVNHLDCGDANMNDVGWVFENVADATSVVNFAAGAIGFGMGLTGTTDSNDCMCGWLTNCQASGAACTFSSAANAQIACNGETDPQDDTAILANFCTGGGGSTGG